MNNFGRPPPPYNEHLNVWGAILVKWTMGVLSMQTVHQRGHNNRANVWEIAKFRRLLERVYDIQNSVQDGSKQNCQSRYFKIDILFPTNQHKHIVT